MALELALLAAALVAGLTGAWSPCGFSMVETIGPRGHSGGRAATLAACATFTLGAVAGGAATFGALAWLGDLVHGAAGRSAYLAAAALAIAAAALELRGGRIVPQIRRQLPEPWRWRMPMPAVAALYGVLLGLGFTTFVLTFGVWALAGISFAVGDPALGLGIGAAFGIGRALPVVVIAPLIERPLGQRMNAAMAERPGSIAAFGSGTPSACSRPRQLSGSPTARPPRAHPAPRLRASSPPTPPTPRWRTPTWFSRIWGGRESCCETGSEPSFPAPSPPPEAATSPSAPETASCCFGVTTWPRWPATRRLT